MLYLIQMRAEGEVSHSRRFSRKRQTEQHFRHQLAHALKELDNDEPFELLLLLVDQEGEESASVLDGFIRLDEPDLDDDDDDEHGEDDDDEDYDDEDDKVD